VELVGNVQSSTKGWGIGTKRSKWCLNGAHCWDGKGIVVAEQQELWDGQGERDEKQVVVAEMLTEPTQPIKAYAGGLLLG
jgi:hypothetical protein